MQTPEYNARVELATPSLRLYAHQGKSLKLKLSKEYRAARVSAVRASEKARKSEAIC